MIPTVGAEPIPGHTLTRPLGAGAFGDVWEAEHDGRPVALKFLDARSRPAGVLATEVRVLRALTGLHHPHIIPLLGVHACGKYLVLVMERADGNLADLHAAYVEKTGANVPPDHALELLAQAAAALDFLAGVKAPGLGARGLQHCDVKPTNLLLLGDRLKVADFGLCAGAGWHTHKGGWKGTPPYAAPELFNGAAVVGTDQYALAVTFCELVMGDRSFLPAAGPDAAPARPIDLTRLREKEFPVISRALHPYPSSRWPTCAAFVAALREAAGQPRRGPSVRIFPRGRRGPMRPAQA
jgi:serine/threonine protein kinase